jgi:predicted enzyme related to lactoylglutathione lyase
MVTIGAVHISSDHPKELGEFYRKVLGVEPEFQSDEGAGFLVGDSRLMILKHDHIHSKNSSPERMFYDLIVSDVAAEVKRVVAIGATLVQEPYPFDDRNDGMKMVFATLADLDGNYFQLVSMTPA